MPDKIIPINGPGQILTSDGTSRIAIPVGSSLSVVTAKSSASGLISFSSGNTKEGWFGIVSGNISANTNTITISNIPQTYQDLMLIVQACNSNTTAQQSGDLKVALNAATGAVHSYSNNTVVTGASLNGGGDAGGAWFVYYNLAMTTTSTYPDEVASVKAIIYRYASSVSHKPFFGSGNRYYGSTSSSAHATCFVGGTYKSNTPVTSILVVGNATSEAFRATQTTWALYGRGSA